jgi:hypothetical protein
MRYAVEKNSAYRKFIHRSGAHLTRTRFSLKTLSFQPVLTTVELLPNSRGAQILISLWKIFTEWINGESEQGPIVRASSAAIVSAWTFWLVEQGPRERCLAAAHVEGGESL